MQSKITFYKAFSCLGTFELAPLSARIPSQMSTWPAHSFLSDLYLNITLSVDPYLLVYLKSPILNSLLLHFFIFIVGTFLIYHIFTYLFYFFWLPSLFTHQNACFMKERICSVLFTVIFPVPGKKLLNLLNK